MGNATHSSKSVKPVSGSCRWIHRIGEVDANTGLLLINGQPYGVVLDAGNYRLVKPDGTVYDLEATADGFRCDCPDATFRQRECKHAKALKAALAVAGK